MASASPDPYLSHLAIDYKTPDEAYYGIENNVDFTREAWLKEAA